MLIPGKGEEGIAPIHEVAAEQGVWVNDRGQRIDDRSSMEVDHKEDLQEEQQEYVSPQREVLRGAGSGGSQATPACRTEVYVKGPTPWG